MGNVKKIYLITIFFFNIITTQSQVVKLTERDSIILVKKEELHEGGLIFYKDEYSLTLFNRDNAHYNKKNGYEHKTLPDGRRYCEKCKKEYYVFFIKKIHNIPLKLDSGAYTVEDIFRNTSKFTSDRSYFLIDGDYYKNLGMPVK